MTAYDTDLPDTPADPDPTAGVRVTRVSRDGARDNATGIVWHIAADAADDPGATATADAGDSPLTSRLARHLVAIYSDVHSTVIDFDADANLRHAAETTGRRYLAVTNPTDPAASASQPRLAALIMLRWPRPATTAPAHDAHSLLSACQQHLTDDGSTIVVVTAATPGAVGTSYGGHEQTLLPAAETAGLRHLHDIVPLDADDGRDVFTYAIPRDTTASSRASDSDTTRQTTSTILVIFGHPGRRPSASRGTVTPHDSDRGRGRQNRHPDPVIHDTTAGQGDKDLPPGDRDDRPTRQTNESSYAAAPAAVPPLQIELPQHDPIITPPAARALLRLVQRTAARCVQPDIQQPSPDGSSP